jgi:hypothetical protein
MEEKPVTDVKEQRRYASRKFTLTVGLIALSTVLLIAKLVTSDIWADLVGMLAFIYIGGNVGEAAVGKWRGGK